MGWAHYVLSSVVGVVWSLVFGVWSVQGSRRRRVAVARTQLHMIIIINEHFCLPFTRTAQTKY